MKKILKPGERKRGENEIKNPEQIVKQRLRLEFIKRKNTANQAKKQINRKKHAKKIKKKSSK